MSQTNSASRLRAFTLIELLVVVSIIVVLIGVLMPALSSARNEGTRIKCLANLRALGQAMETYGTDDASGYTAPVHPRADIGWIWDGEYEWGGKTGVGVYAHPDFLTENRILNRYLYGPVPAIPFQQFQCPGDTGIPPAPTDFDGYFFIPVCVNKSAWQVTGTSYRLNNHIDFTRKHPEFSEHFYGPYHRMRTRVPDPASTVLLEEAVAEVAKWNDPGYRTMGWHRRPNVFEVSFTDGHAGSIHLAGQSDWTAAYPDYWVLRGDGWRMDCYPDRPVCDRYAGCRCCNEP